MEFQISRKAIDKQTTDCIVIGLDAQKKLGAAAKRLNEISDGYLQKMIKRKNINLDANQLTFLPDVPGIKQRVLVVGLGEANSLSDAKFNKLCRDITQTLESKKMKSAVIALHDMKASNHKALWQLNQFIIAAYQQMYRFNDFKSESNNKSTLAKINFYVSEQKQEGPAQLAIQEACAIGRGMDLCKDLGNTPGNTCTPSYLARKAKALDKQFKTLKTQVLTEAEMKKLGMGAFLSVSKGSTEPGKLIVMEYRGTQKSRAPIVLVGKGITFDSGGISLKPGAQMDEMKYDMCGAASVFGVMQAVAELQLPVNVIGVVAAAENMPGGQASKPGDVVKSASGQTIEILNTDAEGRLVLCDALTYVKKFKPEVVIDIATLTGAMIVALGDQAAGVMTNHDPLARELISAGADINDRLWQLPLWDEYHEQLESNFADMANIGGRGAGSITAGCFLAKFAKDYHWAHMDIAGTAWVGGKSKGATGRPVPALMQFILNRCH